MLLQSENIYLSPLDTVSQNYSSWMNDPEVLRYLECRFQLQSHASIRDYVIRMNSDPNVVFLGIYYNLSPEVELVPRVYTHVGNVKLTINRIHRFAEVGIVIGKSHWGKGIATETLKLISKYAFNILNLHKLWAGCYADNYASIRGFEKAGFDVEGRLKNQYWSNDHYTDDILLGLINPREK